MSDPKDLQVKTEMPGDWIYQLRRIGPPATCKKVPDIMRLNLGLTKIGRGQNNDYYLDSAVLKNFISRSHAEIYGNMNENGVIEFVLKDLGLNGTFRNDIRTHKTCPMELDDIITFGHINGYKIQPGSYADQPSSEFQFKFERIPKISKSSEIFEEPQPIVINLSSDELDEIPIDLKKDTTVTPDRSFLSDIQSNVQMWDKGSKSQPPIKSCHRHDSTSHSDNEISVPHSKNNLISKNDNLSKKSDSDSASSSKSSPREMSFTSMGNFNVSMENTTNVPKEENNVSKKAASVNLSKKHSSGGTKSHHTKQQISENDDSEDLENESEAEEVKKPVKGKSFRIQRKTAPARNRKLPEPPNVPEPPKTPELPSELEENTSEDETSKSGTDQRSRVQSKNRQRRVKKKRAGNDAPAIGSRKKRRRVGGGGSGFSASSSVSKDNLEPGVEWYEDDKCEAADCKRPKKKRTQWVQCDDCDGWYHTMCVGANYNKLKNSDEHFNCGCILD